MNEDTVRAIQEALAPVAEKIGSGAEYTWEILVWGQFAEGIGFLIVLTIAGIALFAGWRLLFNLVPKEDYQEPQFVLPIIMLGLASFFWGMTFLIGGLNALIKIIAPEYAAIKLLLGLVTG